MIRRTFALLLLAVLLAPSAALAGVDVDPSDLSPEIFIDADREVPGQAHGSAEQPNNAPLNSGTPGSDPSFTPISSCQVDPVVGTYGCGRPEADPGEPDDDRKVTPGDVLRAVREIGLPALRVQVQPGTATLVNVPTIFFAEPRPFERTVELVGFDVDLVAEPVGYRWDHGDGTVATTDTPGRPYPAMDVVHRYETPADSVRTRVDVTYRVRFRVDGGAWQTLAQPIVAAGPPTALAVDEAAPVLTRP